MPRTRAVALASLPMAAALAAAAVVALSQGVTEPPLPPAPDSPPLPYAPHRDLVNTPTVPEVDSGLRTPSGAPVGIGCGACHFQALDSPQVLTAEDLDDFHAGLTFEHGALTCASCHDSGNQAGLHLADGSEVAWEDSMEQCAQCHGPQHRDYLNGSHGGMTGHWDRVRGPRVRNHCIDCHDPHAPAYPQVLPVFAPRDRFLNSDAPAAPNGGGGDH